MNYEKADKLQSLCEIILPRLGRPDIRAFDIQYWESISGEHGWSIHLTSDEAEIPESIIPDLIYRLKIDAPTITPIEVRIFS